MAPEFADLHSARWIFAERGRKNTTFSVTVAMIEVSETPTVSVAIKGVTGGELMVWKRTAGVGDCGEPDMGAHTSTKDLRR